MNAKTSLVVVWFHESEREISDGSWKRQSKTWTRTRNLFLTEPA